MDRLTIRYQGQFRSTLTASVWQPIRKRLLEPLVTETVRHDLYSNSTVYPYIYDDAVGHAETYPDPELLTTTDGCSR